MRIGRTLPPAAAPIGFREIAAGMRAHFEGARAVDRLQAGIAAHFGVRHCFLVGSGKAALTLILLALKDLNPDRDEVVIPAYTCYSVPASVLRAGLRIRLCDLARNSLDFDSEQLSANLSAGERVLAVVPTHLYGIGVDVASARQAAAAPAIAVVEDAAQAMGEERGGRKLGALADAGFFSLGRGKSFSTVEGGVILTDRDDLAQALRSRLESVPGYGWGALLMLFLKAVALAALMHPLAFWIPRALPFLRLGETLFERDFPIRRLSPFQAGLARDWAERLQAMRDSRRAIARQWRHALDGLGARSATFPQELDAALVRFPLRVRDAGRRAALLEASAGQGLGIAPGYPRSLNRLDDLKGELPAQDCPAAERAARELVTLPTHGFVNPGDVAAICRLLAGALAADPRTAGHAAAAPSAGTPSGIGPL